MTVEIRTAREADYEAYTRLFAELEVPDPVPGRARYLASIAPQLRLACRDGEVVGFASWRAYGSLVHVVQLAVDRAVRGQRIGERLLRHVGDEARAAGCTRWYLNVKRDNAPALRLYERVGFRFEHESVALTIAWRRLPPRPVRSALADAADDPAIAAQLGIPVERIAMFRARAAKLLVIEDPAGARCGFAAFDPSYPGAAIFRTTHPEHAAALLEAMRAHALPDRDFVHVTVEGDRPLADAVLALGGELVFELHRLSAPL